MAGSEKAKVKSEKHPPTVLIEREEPAPWTIKWYLKMLRWAGVRWDNALFLDRRNSVLRYIEVRKRLKERIAKKYGVVDKNQHPASRIQNQESSIQNQESSIQNPE